MTRIDRLLEADHKNEVLAKRVLEDFTPELLEALENAAAIFEAFSKCFGARPGDTTTGKLCDLRCSGWVTPLGR
jgi:hypothetical protein